MSYGDDCYNGGPGNLTGASTADIRMQCLMLASTVHVKDEDRPDRQRTLTPDEMLAEAEKFMQFVMNGNKS